jgi:uncharacterized protein YndB with AHSA1/START domain
MNASDEPSVTAQIFEASLAEVWAAISEVEQMRRWFFANIEAFEPYEGFKTKFTIENEGRSFPYVWKVTKAAPMRLLSYTWKYQKYQGDSEVIFELSKQHHQTKLTLTHQVTASFQEGIPEFSRQSCKSGWMFFIKQELKRYLEEKNLQL